MPCPFDDYLNNDFKNDLNDDSDRLLIAESS